MFEVKNLSEEKSIVCQILKELRDKEIQQDRYRFRKNIERIGMIAAYEISKSLDYESSQTQTPLGSADTTELKDQPVIGTVLRAGIPLQTWRKPIIQSSRLGLHLGLSAPNDR